MCATRTVNDRDLTDLSFTGRWFPVSFKLIEAIGLDLGVVMQYLLNHRKAVGSDEEGWFFCTIKKMEDEIQLTQERQTRVLRELTKLKLVKSKRKGLPPKRHFKLNDKKLVDILLEEKENVEGQFRKTPDSNSVESGDTNSVKPGKLIPENPVFHINNNINNNNKGKRKRGRPPAASVPPLDKANAEGDRQRAAELRSILIEHDADIVAPRNGKRPVSLNRLTIVLSNLRKDRNVPATEISQVLKWLGKNYGKTYVPRVRKADDLYTNWEAFRQAKQGRDEDEGRSNTNKSMAEQVEDWLGERGWSAFGEPVTQTDVDTALVALGYEIGLVSPTEVF